MRLRRHRELKKCPQVTQLGSRALNAGRLGPCRCPNHWAAWRCFPESVHGRACREGKRLLNRRSPPRLHSGRVQTPSEELLYYPSSGHHPAMALAPTAYCSTPDWAPWATKSCQNKAGIGGGMTTTNLFLSSSIRPDLAQATAQCPTPWR